MNISIGLDMFDCEFFVSGYKVRNSMDVSNDILASGDDDDE